MLAVEMDPLSAAMAGRHTFLADEIPDSVTIVGFDIPDRWVVGYGLDYDNRFRTLPYIGLLEPVEVKS